MKKIENIEIAEIIEEADEDLVDARTLSRRSAPAARYSASQAAEKYLRALCDATERPAGVMWDIKKVFDTVSDISEIATLEEPVKLLGRFTTPAKAGDGTVVRMQDVLYATEFIKWVVRKSFGVDGQEPEKPESPEEQPNVQSSESIDSAIIENIDEMIPTVIPKDAGTSKTDTATTENREEKPRGHGRDRDDVRPGRSEQERGTSFVKMFLVCERCGVRIPRTRQTAHGRVPCSMCGRPMKLQR